MVHYLMRNSSIVLQNIIVLQALSNGNLLRYGQHLVKLIVRDVVELCTVVFGNDELLTCQPPALSLEPRPISSFAYRMSFAQRPNVQECERLLALEDLHRRDLT
jgi:hypothetical protein